MLNLFHLLLYSSFDFGATFGCVWGSPGKLQTSVLHDLLSLCPRIYLSLLVKFILSIKRR